MWIAAAAVYLGFHRAVYGGWTVYAAGDHFVGGELTVAGVDPNYVGRARRLVGLLVDRSFGLAAWAPVYLLAVVALGGVVRRRPPGWAALVLPLAAGWLTATFVALTMHGFWWPGRQTVVVLPLVVLLVAWWVAQVRVAQRRVVALFGVLVAAGLTLWAWVLGEVLAGHRRLIIDFDQTSNPLYRLWRLALPDERAASASTDVLHVTWIVVVALLAIVGWHSLRDRQRRSIHEDTDTELATAGRLGDPAVVGDRGRVWG